MLNNDRRLYPCGLLETFLTQCGYMGENECGILSEYVKAMEDSDDPHINSFAYKLGRRSVAGASRLSMSQNPETNATDSRPAVGLSYPPTPNQYLVGNYSKRDGEQQIVARSKQAVIDPVINPTTSEATPTDDAVEKENALIIFMRLGFWEQYHPQSPQMAPPVSRPHHPAFSIIVTIASTPRTLRTM
jgi:hypothetical protein